MRWKTDIPVSCVWGKGGRQMAKKDYYEILGVTRSADEKEIKRAYRNLAKKYHPDTNAGNRRAEQKFKEITEAYNILSDPEKRKLYDRFGFAAFDGSMGTDGSDGARYTEYHFKDGEAEQVFEDLFGEGFGGWRGFGGDWQSGRDAEAEITISFEEAAFGCTKQIAFENGGNRLLEVRIPAGIDEGQRVRLKGKGRRGGTAAGDLFLKVHIATKPGYERKGRDVYTTENIPYTTAALGGEATFHTLYGEVKCRIPAGTQSGSRIRLKNKGIVSMKDPSLRGDAFVTVQIAVPRNLSPWEKKKLQELERGA